MPFAIDHTVEIDACAAEVWSVITDLDAYGEWNPFVVACRSTLVVGDPIDMKVRLFESFTQKQRETILEHEPGKRLAYGVAGLPLGALSSLRSHEVHTLDANRTRYRSHFELDGWLAPLVQALLGTRLRKGFDGMTRALADRAQSMQNTRQTTAPVI
jgi:uncharacterized protein YndB with AHSA1/START domain